MRLYNLIQEIDELRVRREAKDFGNEAERLLDAYETTERPFGYAVLTPDEKSDIHERLETIRTIIEGSELPNRKKNALYRKLNSLSAEVDRDGTLTDAFFALGGDLAATAGEMAEKAKPAMEELKAILKIIFGRRLENEEGLPPPDNIAFLPKENDN